MIVCTGQRTFILDAFFRSASQLTGYIHGGFTWICKVASLYCIFAVNGYDGCNLLLGTNNENEKGSEVIRRVMNLVWVKRVKAISERFV